MSCGDGAEVMWWTGRCGAKNRSFAGCTTRAVPDILGASLKVETGGKAIEQVVREIAGELNLDHRISGEEK